MRTAKMFFLLAALVFITSLSRGAIIFEDDFTGDNGTPLNSDKWTTSASSGVTLNIQNNSACINAPTGYKSAIFTAKTTADFFADNAVATYSIDFTESNMNLYCHRKMSVTGNSASVVLAWTTDWTGSVSYDTYSLSITGLGTVWTGTKNWDTGRNLSLILTPTTYEVIVSGVSTASGSATGLHGLSASAFTNGGLWSIWGESSSAKPEVIYFDNAMIDYVPEPATMGILGIGILFSLYQRRRTVIC